MTDPLQIVADLKPAQLDHIAEDAYARRRASDLARALGAEGAPPGGPPPAATPAATPGAGPCSPAPECSARPLR
jgi:hypothetical protein